jgi:hypothetical protein
MASSTQWRFDFHALSTTGVLILYEVAIYDGITNLCTGGTATADSGTAANAFDGDAATTWQSDAATAPYAHWLAYEFASPVTDPTSYSIKGNASRPPKDWTLSYWDGAAWVVWDTRGPFTGSAWSGNATLTFVPAVAASPALRSGDFAMPDVSKYYAQRRIVTAAVGADGFWGVPVPCPIACTELIITNTDGSNAQAVRTDPNDPDTELALGTSASMTIRASSSGDAVWQAGDVVCRVKPASGTGPVVVRFTR